MGVTDEKVWRSAHGFGYGTDISPRVFMKKEVFVLAGGLLLSSLGHAAGPLIISEIMANNNTSISDDFGNKEDWIEIQNISTNIVNLGGWYLTETTNNLKLWQFPATNLAPNNFMIVFASSRDRRIPGATLHTSFKLNNDGEYLALVQPDGTNIASEFRDKFPIQAADVSYGFASDARDIVIVNTNAPARALVPSADMALLWADIGFNDTSWANGTLAVGYDNTTTPIDYNLLQGLNVSNMFNVNQTVYIRVPFVLTNVTEIDTMTLTMLYDDGFVAYVNGHEMARDNANDPLLFNSGAPANRADATAITPANVNVTPSKTFLQIGTNILAFQALNNGVGSSDLLLAPKLTARTLPSGSLVKKYFPAPTPGTNNLGGVDVLGPLITEAQHTPATPQTNETITVTARIRPAFSPVATTKLRYRVMYTPEVEISMLDDGLHGDGLAGDGVYGASIPAGIATPGQMIRWNIHATDSTNALSRLPTFVDATHSPEYFGTIVSIAQTNKLEILHWFIQNATGADNTTGTRAALFFIGEFYDNVGMNLHGQSSSGFPKKSYDIDFHRGYNFRWASGEPRVDDLNLLTIYPDKAHMRNILAYEVFRDAGTPYHFVRPVRVQQNGVFFSDAHMVENGDENYLDRLGMDTQGALYKMYNTLNAATGEKKTRKDEGTQDLQALINGSLLSGPARNAYLFDNLNLPEITSYLAAQTVIGNTDCCHKNYYLYRDTVGTGEWQILPWDVDLSFGRVWSGTPTYWDDVLYSNTRLFIGDNNTLVAAIYNTPELRQMYLRRLRTLMEELIQPPGTPTAQGKFEKRFDELAAQIAPDAALDLAKWGTWCCNAAGPYTQGTIPQASSWQTLSNAVDYMKTNYMPARRTYLFTQAAEVPVSQPSNAMIIVTSVDYSPASSNQSQEYVELRNTNTYAVDLSNWRLSGGIDFTLAPGTVMPANSYLYVSPDVRAFRSRTTGPRGGQGLYVVGPYKGQLSARGEAVQLADRAGRITSKLAYPGTPTWPQQYLRITELMYHPAPLSGNTNSPEEFEYVELKNIGPVTLNLNGVRFTNGIVFNFTGSLVTSLPPGQTVLVVKNATMFTTRYGLGFSIAGQYEGYLDNAGERIQLLDAVGEEILDFSYNNSWYPITDGLGFSLIVVNENAAPDDWNSKTNWRPSTLAIGSPGGDDLPPLVFAPVLINEALTRTLAQPDAIELYNPNTNTVDISGWFLSDDFIAPKKFRIPNGTLMSPGTYRVYTESNFNVFPGASTNFALSSDGDEVFLFSADSAGNLTGYFHGFDFGAADENVSFGRYVTSEGKEEFVQQSLVTLNATNAGPRVGPIVISEIMYHPINVGTNDNTTNEFVELLNISSNTVPLYDPLRPTNTWKLTGGADFAFPTNVSLAPGEALLVLNIVATNAAAANAFRTTYGLSPSVQLFGPYGGVLNNDSDDIKLRKPTQPLTNGVIPYVLMDRVEYLDLLPWPQAADGFGFSIQRWIASSYGNDPTNWIAGPVSPAFATQTNGTPPTITAHPTNQTVVAGQTVTLTAGVAGTAPLGYQWRWNGTNLPGATNLPLVFTNVLAGNAGVYELIAFNPVGVVFSHAATLVVRVPVVIVQHPQTLDVRIQPDPGAAPTTNATFTVIASSVAPMQYQWRRNGTDIFNATNSTYTVINVKTNDLAQFSVRVTDDISSVESSNAWLYPWIAPQFIDSPIAQSVAVGTPVTLSASFFGWPPPFTLEWRLGAAPLSSITNDQMIMFYTFTAPATVGSQSYRAVVKNRAVPAGRATGFTAVTTLADTDGDGIPDEWEIRYGFSTNNIADRLLDSDGDGMLNWQEYIAGTDPTNALSSLKLASTISSNGVGMNFQAMSNKTYAVQYTTSLGANWQTLRPVIALRSNTVQTASDPLTGSNRFYRVVTPAQ